MFKSYNNYYYDNYLANQTNNQLSSNAAVKLPVR